MRYERIDAGASTPSGTFMSGDGEEKLARINRLSFVRFLVRKIIKREVDGEINFKNPFYKKLGTRKFFTGCGSKNRVRSKEKKIGGGEKNCSFDRFVLKIIG